MKLKINALNNKYTIDLIGLDDKCKNTYKYLTCIQHEKTSRHKNKNLIRFRLDIEAKESDLNPNEALDTVKKIFHFLKNNIKGFLWVKAHEETVNDVRIFGFEFDADIEFIESEFLKDN